MSKGDRADARERTSGRPGSVRRRGAEEPGRKALLEATMRRDLEQLVHDFRNAPEQVGHYLRELDSRSPSSALDLAEAHDVLVRLAGPRYAARALGLSPSPERRATALAERIAPALGLRSSDIALHIDAEARRRTEAESACGLMEAGHVYLHPEAFDPDSADGRYLLGHELAHVAQRQAVRLGEVAPGARMAAELEAAAVGSDFALGRTPLAPRVGLAPQAVAADSGAGAAARTLPEIRERLLAGEYEGEGAYDQRAIATDLKGPGTVVVGNFQNADLQRFLVHTIQNWKPLRKHWELHYYNRLKQRKQAAAAQGQSSRDMQSDIPPVFDGPYPFQPCDGTESMSSPAWTGAAQNRTGGEHPRWVTVFQEVLMGLDEPADANAPPPSPWAYNPAPVTGSWDDEASAVQRLCSLYLNSWTSERGSQHSSVDEFQENVGGSLKNEQPSPHMAGGATQDSTNKSNWCTQASNSMLVLGLMRQGLRFSKVAIDPYLAQRHELVPGATSVQMGSKTVPFFNQITSAMTYFTYAAAPGVWFPGGCPVPYWTDSAPFLQFQRAHVNELDTEGAAENWINTHKGQLEADHKADHPGDSGLQPGDIIMVVSRGGAPTGHTVTVAHREPEGKAWDEPGQNVSVLSGNSVGLEGLTSAKKWSDTGYARTDGVVRSERYLTAKDGGYSYQRACSLAPAYQNAYAAFRADIKARENREPTYNEINQFRQKFESDNQVKLNPDIPSGTVQVVSVTRSSQLNAHELVNDAAKQKQLGLAAFDLLASFGRSKEEEQLLAQVFHGVPGKKKT